MQKVAESLYLKLSLLHIKPKYAHLSPLSTGQELPGEDELMKLRLVACSYIQKIFERQAAELGGHSKYTDPILEETKTKNRKLL